MKTLAKITLIAAGLAAAACTIPALHAADNDPTAPAGQGTLAGKHPRLRALLQRKAVRQRIARRLGLTADQITQLKATRASTAAAVKAVRSDSSLTTDQKKAKVRETLQAARTQWRGTLTPDQQATLKKAREALRDRVKARRGL